MQNNLDPDTRKLLSLVFAFLFPPLAVLIQQDFQLNSSVLLSCILTLLGYIPGTVYALYKIFS